MRRCLSLSLLLAISLPLLAPLLALGQASEAMLLACCRRNGKHHCMMASMGEPSQGSGHDPEFRAPLEKCPCCPVTAVSVHTERWSTPATAQAIFADIVSHPSGTPQTAAKWRIAHDRSRQKRGPPALFFL